MEQKISEFDPFYAVFLSTILKILSYFIGTVICIFYWFTAILKYSIIIDSILLSFIKIYLKTLTESSSFRLIPKPQEYIYTLLFLLLIF